MTTYKTREVSPGVFEIVDPVKKVKFIILILLSVFILAFSVILMIQNNQTYGCHLIIEDEVLAQIQDEWQEMTVVATAYTAGYESTGKNPGHPAYGITKTGTKVLEGRTIAVDPDVISLGSEVRIPCLSSYTYIAEDIGGAIKGNKIDIYMKDLQSAKNWGRRTVKILVKRK